MKIKFRSNLIIDGIEYKKGQSYDMADWLARAFVGSGHAEVPGLSVLGSEKEKKKPITKAPAKKKTSTGKAKK